MAYSIFNDINSSKVKRKRYLKLVNLFKNQIILLIKRAKMLRFSSILNERQLLKNLIVYLTTSLANFFQSNNDNYLNIME